MNIFPVNDVRLFESVKDFFNTAVSNAEIIFEKYFGFFDEFYLRGGGFDGFGIGDFEGVYCHDRIFTWVFLVKRSKDFFNFLVFFVNIKSRTFLSCIQKYLKLQLPSPTLSS
jgi:hypothetical protein